jgi:hypothetical protein
MIRNNKATQSNKWQQKRVRNDEVRTLNVNRGFIDGTQGANKKIKVFPRSLKIDSFNWLIKNKKWIKLVEY